MVEKWLKNPYCLHNFFSFLMICILLVNQLALRKIFGRILLLPYFFSSMSLFLTQSHELNVSSVPGQKKLAKNGSSMLHTGGERTE
jgi:hypothetical protein